MTSVYDFDVTTIDGASQSLADYEGKVLLVVNVASRCGLTPQYEGLQELYETYGERGFEVLGFPCNQFAFQEPGTEAKIAEFCETRYGVSFPMYGKVRVNGIGAEPLFRHLRKEGPRTGFTDLIEWNFTKFLVNRDGEVVGRYAPTVKPEKIAEDIEALLEA